MRIYFISKISCLITTNDISKHLTISKKNILFNSLSLEKRMLVLSNLNRKNSKEDIKAANTTTNPIEFIIWLLPCKKQMSNNAHNVPREDSNKSRTNTTLRLRYCKLRNLSLQFVPNETKLFFCDNIIKYLRE